MCNLYSITTNQEAIRALFRVMNRYVGKLAPMPGVFPDYRAPISSAMRVQNASWSSCGGHAAAAAHWRATGHQHPQHVLAKLARLAQAGEPVLVALQ
jgi:hypothetical protein